MRAIGDFILVVLFVLLAGLCLSISRFRAVAASAPGTLRGRASWYGEGYRGKTMANGKPFNPDDMTCAMWDYPFGTMLRAKHVNSGRVVYVEVTDRGPAKWTGCIIDLSSAAFRKLEDTSAGKIAVEISVVRLGGNEGNAP